MLEINQIHNIDCLEGLKQIPDNSVDFILTDPPYNINLNPQRDITDKIQNDNFIDIEFIAWFVPIVKELNRVLKDNSFIIMFCGWSTIPLFRNILDNYWKLKSMPIWVKNNYGIGYYTRPKYEPCLLYFKGEPKPLDKPISDVWEFDKVLNPKHSCEKPVKLMRYIINSFSKEGDVILDPFAGLGSVCIASKQSRRQYLGFEIDSNYVEIAQKRLSQKVLFPLAEQQEGGAIPPRDESLGILWRFLS
jgi:site-specific DNA-methyltransferase (adenine-specific)